MSQTYSDKTRRAIRKYGIEACVGAYNLHRHGGWGARGISCEGGFGVLKTTQQADAAINAGREILYAEVAPFFDHGVKSGDRVEAGVGDDHDTGRVVRILTATTCEVAWDSGVRTPAAFADLKRLEA